MHFDPKDDGITHINVYSKGKTFLGKWLSNFTYSPIETIDGKFNSIEGYWYWLSIQDERFRKLHGFKAKQLGRELNANDWPNTYMFRQRIKAAILYKILSKPEIIVKLKRNKLPLTHYYVYGDKVINVPNAEWIINFLTEFCDG